MWCNLACRSVKYIIGRENKLTNSHVTAITFKRLKFATCVGCGQGIHTSSTSYADSTVYDVIVAGGGMVGTSMACSLGQSKMFSDKQILLLEGNPASTWTLKPNFSNRVSALNKHTRSFLSSIGAWESIASARFKTVKKLQVWDACSEALITFNHDNMDDDVAYIVENNVVLAALDKEVKKLQKNVNVLYKAKVKNYVLPSTEVSENDLVEVQLEDGTTYKCRLLVGADGANSKVRQTMGVKYVSWNYDQMGVVATLKLSEPTENVVAWQRFLPSGPIALLPLTSELSSLVWSTSTDHAKELLNLPADCFVDAVNDALWKKFPHHEVVDSVLKGIHDLVHTISPVVASMRQLQPSVSDVDKDSRAAFPLGFGHATKYVMPAVALIGDAAHRVHPLAGQGVNLGFGDAECLTRLLAEAVYSGSDVGKISHLLSYETERQRHNFPTMVAIDGLQKLYSTSFLPVVMLRSLGLQLTNSILPVKRAIMERAGV